MNIPLRQYWDLLSRHIQPQKGRFILLTLFLVSGIGLQIANPEILRSFIDSALGGAATSRLLVTGLAFMGIALLGQVLSVSVTYLGESVAWTATNALRAELAWHCLDLDMGFHNDHTPGELIERIDGDVAELSNFFSQLVVTLIGNLLLLIGILVVLFFTEWRAGLAFMLFAILAVYALFRVRDIAVPHQKARRQAEAELFGFIEEQLAGTEDVRSNGAEGYSLRELYRLQSNILKSDRKAQWKHWIIGNIMAGFIVTGNILAITVGFFLYKGGAISVGTVYLFIYYMNLLEQPIWTLTHEVQSFQMIGACVGRLTDLRKIQPRIKDGMGKNLPEGPLPLVFEDVSFAYHSSPAINGTTPAQQIDPAIEKPAVPEMPVVLRNLTFHLKKGKILGLLGRTGSGKTTLARLVFRLYDPTSGCIQLDSTNIRDARLESLRGRVALVTQDIQLFRASVRDNITFFDDSISDQQIQTAIADLGLADWYQSLPEGLDTQLEAGGRSLSAGEAQLLAFTRVFLRNPGLVILDEASSRLDPATEQRIERAIDKLLVNRTAIIIAHRLGTVQRADEVMILENGEISEYGERRLLASEPASRFYSLLQTGLEEMLA